LNQAPRFFSEMFSKKTSEKKEKKDLSPYPLFFEKKVSQKNIHHQAQIPKGGRPGPALFFKKKLRKKETGKKGPPREKKNCELRRICPALSTLNP